MATKKKGRPTKYTPQLANKICAQIMEGRSLRRICSSEDMPAMSTVMLWLQDGKYPEFSEQYAQARQIQYHLLADELLDIADDASNDWMSREGKDGEESYQLNGEHVQRSRVRIDTRKWMLAKMLPKIYGDKVEQSVSQEGENKYTIQIVKPDESN